MEGQLVDGEFVGARAIGQTGEGGRPGFFIRFGRWLERKMFYMVLFFGITLIIGLFLYPRIIIIIRVGEAGVIYRPFSGGTDVANPFHEGLYFLWPMNTMGIYNMRIETRFHEMSVLTIKGMKVDLKLSIRSRPIFETLGLLHQNVGPNYFNKVVIPEVESVLRSTLGGKEVSALYQSSNDVLSQVVTDALDAAGQRYVAVDDVIIREIHLPESIKSAIEDKLINEQRFAAYEFRLAMEKQERRRKIIEADGIRKYNAMIQSGLTPALMTWTGIQATLSLATSANAKVVVVGNGQNGMPLILGGLFDSLPPPAASSPPASLSAPLPVTPTHVPPASVPVSVLPPVITDVNTQASGETAIESPLGVPLASPVDSQGGSIPPLPNGQPKMRATRSSSPVNR